METVSSNNSFLTSKIVQNIVIVISVFNIIGYIVMGNGDAVIYFIILSILMWSFSKNLTIVLGVPIIFVNLFAMMNENVIEKLTKNM